MCVCVWGGGGGGGGGGGEGRGGICSSSHRNNHHSLQVNDDCAVRGKRVWHDVQHNTLSHDIM